MARLARAVFPGHPHHVTQRGNGRARTFFENANYALYRDLLAEHCAAAGLDIWTWVQKVSALSPEFADDRSAEDTGYDQSRLGGALTR